MLQDKGRTNLKRRRLTAGLVLGLVGSIAGCGGGEDGILSSSVKSATRVPAPGPAPDALAPASGSAPASGALAWDVAPSRSLALTPGSSFDLASTLPASVTRGGVFEVDGNGSPLPPGISLSPHGLLFVSSSATGGTAGVIFRYTPPA